MTAPKPLAVGWFCAREHDEGIGDPPSEWPGAFFPTGDSTPCKDDPEVVILPRAGWEAFVAAVEQRSTSQLESLAEAGKAIAAEARNAEACHCEQRIEQARREERATCLDWIASEARDCGCSARIAAAIRAGDTP